MLTIREKIRKGSTNPLRKNLIKNVIKNERNRYIKNRYIKIGTKRHGYNLNRYKKISLEGVDNSGENTKGVDKSAEEKWAKSVH